MIDPEGVGASPLSPNVESRPGLLRALGPGMATAIVVGNVIGSGIFAKPGQVALEGGSFGLIITAWISAGLLCLMGALCYAELAVMLPRAGGAYVYLGHAYGRPVGFLYGWNDFLFGRPASIGALSSFFAYQLGKVLGWNLEFAGEVLLPLAVIVLLAGVNIAGVIWGGRMQGATTILKMALLALIALLPVICYELGTGGVDPANLGTQLSKPATGGFAVMLLSIMWAYDGWEGVTPVAEEIREPQRNIPIALFAGLGTVMVLYVSANVAYHTVLSMDEVAASQNVAVDVMKRLLGSHGETLMAAGMMVSAFGAINSNMLLGPRVSFAMGRDDVFFRQLGRVHVNFRTPVTAIVVQALMSSALILSAAILVRTVPALYKTSIFDLLTNYFVFSASIFYVLNVLAIFVLRRRHPEWARPYRTLGYPVVPVIYLLFYGWFMSQIYVARPYEANIGIALIALGLPVYWGWRAWAIRNPPNLRDGE
ncbi:MAG: APC family permease [Planctomycetaceae bacterium]